MPFKGFNSILFDFDSIIDKELTIIKWIASEYRYSELSNFDKHRILTTTIDNFKFYRIYGYFGECLFKSLITNKEYKTRAFDIIDKFYEDKSEEILDKKYIVQTSMVTLINGYRVAADGAIKTTIRCSNEIEEKCIRQICGQGVNIIVKERKDVNTEDYGRIIVGNYKDIVEYNITLPKSIVVLDFKENMSENDITQVNPELIINFGDIHDIRVISAYSSVSGNTKKNIKG